MIAGSVFCEVLHLEAICRKHDSTYQDVAFFRRHFVTFSRKKRWSRRWCLIHNKMWRLLEDVSLPSTGNKKVMREPLPYTGENVSTPSFLLPIMEVKNMLIRNVQVAHNFFTIVLYNKFCTFVWATKIVTAQVCHQAYLPGWQLWEKMNMDPYN